MKKILMSMFYGAVILAATAGLTSCGGSKSSSLTVDGKTYTISIKELTYADGYCKIQLQTDKELIEKFEELNSSPFWLGAINGKEYTSAVGKVAIKDGMIFAVQTPVKPSKIVVFTPDHGSIIEYDGATLQPAPNPAVEEISNLIHSINPELCKKFDSYQPLSSSQNMAGISFDIVSGQMRTNTFGMIKYDNVEIKSRESYANEFTTHFYAVDADNPTKSLDVQLRSGHSFDNTEFFGILTFTGDADAKHALIIFKGTGNGVPAHLTTPSFFYVVELGDKYVERQKTYTSIKAYCKTPYLTGDIFKSTETDK